MESAKKEARNHIVTFRLTKAEYERLKNICEENATSISDTARNAVLALAPAALATGSIEISLDKFDEKLNQILTLLHGLKEGKEC